MYYPKGDITFWINNAIQGRVIPVACALMTRRRKSAYWTVLDALDRKHVELTGRGLSPVTTVTDFEVRRTQQLPCVVCSCGSILTYCHNLELMLQSLFLLFIHFI
jgi:hypothetical protein